MIKTTWANQSLGKRTVRKISLLATTSILQRLRTSAGPTGRVPTDVHCTDCGKVRGRSSTHLCASSGVLLNGSSWCTPYCSRQSHIGEFSSFWNRATRTSSGDVCCRCWRATWSCRRKGRSEATWETPLEAKVWNDAVSGNKSWVSVASVLPPRAWF